MINKVILIGNLGADPSITRLQNGTTIANMSLATADRRKDENGNFVDHPQWHKLVAFNQKAEYCSGFKKGQKLYIEGKIRSRKYTDKRTDEEKWITEIIVEDVKNLTPRSMREQNQSEEEPTPPSE